MLINVTHDAIGSKRSQVRVKGQGHQASQIPITQCVVIACIIFILHIDAVVIIVMV